MQFKTGFTLIEIMVVVIIIGVLAAMAMPLYNKAVEKARISYAVQILGTIRDAELRYAAEYGTYSGSLSNLDLDFDKPIVLGAYQGKFFDYRSYASVLNSNPYNNVSEYVAHCDRNSLDAGAFADYFILMNESGEMWSANTQVNKILQGM